MSRGAAPAMERVFVYGTLRRGGYNHRLLRTGSYLGRHRTHPSFTLLDLGPYPGAIGRGRTAIHGELYAVTPRRLACLDRLEEVPEVYVRVRIPTRLGPAWMYLLRAAPPRARAIDSGDWHRRPAAR